MPRLAGIGVVAVCAAGGLTYYFGSQHPARPGPHHNHQHAPLSSRIVKAQTVGIIDFGPQDDRDAFAKDSDDHPLMLLPTRAGLEFVTISAAELANGNPQWTANQMSDGSFIFIFTTTSRCLTAGAFSRQLTLARCDLARDQRWRPVHTESVTGQAIAAYADEATGYCLTAPPPNPEGGPANPGAAVLAPCGRPRNKTQEIAFWWSP